MLTTDEKIAEAFKVIGERLKDIENKQGDMPTMKRHLDDIGNELRILRKSGTIARAADKGDRPLLWMHEEQAKGFGEIILHVAGKKAMEETVNVDGGVLVPEELAANIISLLGVYSKFRKNALRVPMKSDRLMVPKVESDLTIYCPGEGGAVTPSDMSFSQVALTCRKLICLAKASNELEEDSVIALGEIIGQSIVRSLARKEDLIGFLGDGTSTYFGMTGIVGALMAVDATIGNIKGLKVASGNAYSEIALVDFEGVVALLPEEADENAKWYMNRKFYWNVVYPLAVTAGVANLFDILSDRKTRYLLGYPVEFVSCMPSTEDDSQICAILGDLYTGAFLGERKEITIDKSVDVYFANDQVGIRGKERIDIAVYGVGDTTDAGPIVGLITAAS
ncbi:MAG: phage major capsid protein [Planctomycetota bacterium]